MITTSEYFHRGGCSSTSQAGAGDSPPSAIVDAGYGPVLGVDLRMLSSVMSLGLLQPLRLFRG